MKKIVHRVEDGMDRNEILCTTYQMRNFYNQFHDGFFSNLDVMNYIQHFKAAQIAKKGNKVLDVCCGRSLMLPLLRYYAKDIESYTGVDISMTNIKEAMRGASKKLEPGQYKTYYPFKVEWKNGNVAEMSKVIPENSIDFIIYTSALEHMHPEDGKRSLIECYKVAKKGSQMFLSCPNTEGNGYNTQYRAHVYEWGYNELKTVLNEIGFKIVEEVGLVMSAKEMKTFYQTQPKEIQEFYKKMEQYVPTTWLTAIMSIPYPKASREILFIVEK